MAFVLFVSCSKEDSTDTIAVDGNPISNNKKATGSSSHDLLSGDIYKSMVIELVYVQDLNHQLQQLIIYFFECQIQARRYNGRKRSIASKATFTNQEIVAIEDANRTKYNTANQIAVWALLLTEHPLQTQGTAMF
jgi:hypothetical protein